jgi:hypothetical protein
MTKPLVPSDVPQYRASIERERMRSLGRAIWSLAASRADRSRTVFDIARKAWPADRTVEEIVKAAVTPSDMTSGLAGFAQTLLAALARPSAAADLVRRSGPLTWPEGTGTLSVPGLDMGGRASFVGEGAPIPVGQGVSAKLTLMPFKMAELVPITNEMLNYTSAAQMIMDSFTRQIGGRLDSLMFANTAATSVAPAGLLYGINPTAATPTTGGPYDQAMWEDLSTLAGQVSVVSGNDNENIVFIAASKQATFARLRLGDNQYYPILKSDALTNGVVVAVAVPAVAFVMRDPRFEQSGETAVHMEDTTPLQIGTVGTPNVVAAPTRSMWQTDSASIRFSWMLNYGLRDSRGLAWCQSVNW